MEALYPQKVIEALDSVIYAGTKRSIVASNMLADTPSVSWDQSKQSWTVKAILVFPKEPDPFMKSTLKAAEAAIHYYCGKDIAVEVTATFKPRDTQESPRLLTGVKHIIAVSSGKGGVGKSTVSANLAVSLARMGYSVGLLDCDIYGPSMTKMFGVENARPFVVEKNGRQLIEPVEKYGVKLLSIGFLVDPATATLWRGGMATRVIKQFIEEADWGELDYMVLDTPPGTSDIHLTLIQSLSISGAVIVTTPQQVALADARKGIDMYRNEKVNIPILGLVENMSWFTPEELPNNRYYLFGHDGGKLLAKETGIPLLAQLPIVQSVCESSDIGTPIVLNADSMMGQSFLALAQAVVTVLRRNDK